MSDTTRIGRSESEIAKELFGSNDNATTDNQQPPTTDDDQTGRCTQCGRYVGEENLDYDIDEGAAECRDGCQPSTPAGTPWMLEHVATNTRGTMTLFQGTVPVAIVGTDSLNDHKRALKMTVALNAYTTNQQRIAELEAALRECVERISQSITVGDLVGDEAVYVMRVLRDIAAKGRQVLNRKDGE